MRGKRAPTAGGDGPEAVPPAAPPPPPLEEYKRSDKLSPAFAVSIAINQFYMATTAFAARTLSVYLVRVYFPGASEAVIGPAVGGLGSAFAFAQLATSMLWGYANDWLGCPKLLILLANVVCGAGATWFALATSYGSSMAARIVAGMFMTSGVVMKALIGMTLTKHAQAFAMASRTLGAGSAQIAVPAIVGALADPCKRFGWRRGCGQGGFFKERPFALCAFFIASTGVVATITNFFMIPNVRTRRVDGRSVVIAAPASGGGLFGRKPQKQADVPSSEPDSALPSVTTESKRSTSLPASVKPPPSAFGSSDAAPESAPGSKLPSLTGGRSPDPPPASPPFRRFASMPATAFTRTASALGNARESLRALPRSRTFARTRSMLSQTSSTLDKTLSGWGRDAFASGIIEGDTDLDAAMAAASAVRERRRALKMASGELVLPPPLPPTDAETAAPAKPTPWWRHRPALLSIAAYAAVTFLFDAYYDLVNLYGSAPHDAKIPGLALPVTKLSWMQSLGGACVVLFSVLAYPHIQRRIGVSNCARAGLAAGIPTALVPPTAFYAVPKPAAVLGILAVSQMLYGCAMALTSTSSQILTNLCAPSGSIGAVNGAGNMLSSLSRVLEPTVVGALWALAASDSFPDQWVPWGVLAALFLATLMLYVLSGLKDDDVDAADVGRGSGSKTGSLKKRGSKNGDEAVQ